MILDESLDDKEKCEKIIKELGKLKAEREEYSGLWETVQNQVSYHAELL